jgi:hypothetical protein
MHGHPKWRSGGHEATPFFFFLIFKFFLQEKSSALHLFGFSQNKQVCSIENIFSNMDLTIRHF